MTLASAILPQNQNATWSSGLSFSEAPDRALRWLGASLKAWSPSVCDHQGDPEPQLQSEGYVENWVRYLNDIDSAENLGQWHLVAAYTEAASFIRHGTWGRGGFPRFSRNIFPLIPAKGQKCTFIIRSTNFKHNRLDDLLGSGLHWLPLAQAHLGSWSRLIAWHFRDRGSLFSSFTKQRTIIRVYLAPEERGSANLTWRLWRQAKSGISLISQVVSHRLGVHSWTSWSSALLQGKSASLGNASTPQADLQKSPMHENRNMPKIVLQQPWCWWEWVVENQAEICSFGRNAFKSHFPISEFWFVCYQLPQSYSSLWKLQQTHSTRAGWALDSSTVSSSLHRLSHYLLTATPGAHPSHYTANQSLRKLNDYQGHTALRGEIRTHSQQVL